MAKVKFELEFGGKKRGFLLGIMYLSSLFDKHSDKLGSYGELLEKLSKNSFFNADLLIYESLVAYCERYEQEIDFTINNVRDWLDDDYENNGAQTYIIFASNFLGANDNKTPIESSKKGTKKK